MPIQAKQVSVDEVAGKSTNIVFHTFSLFALGQSMDILLAAMICRNNSFNFHQCYATSVIINIIYYLFTVSHLPLSDVRHDRLEKIRPRIAHVMRSDCEVIAELRSLNAISRTDVNEIRPEKDEYVQSSKLISAIMRRSNHSYDRFQEVLRKTHQKHIVEFLSEGMFNNNSQISIFRGFRPVPFSTINMYNIHVHVEIVTEARWYSKRTHTPLVALTAMTGTSQTLWSTVFCTAVWSAYRPSNF